VPVLVPVQALALVQGQVLELVPVQVLELVLVCMGISFICPYIEVPPHGSSSSGFVPEGGG
jgi:uncharacterized membrane protein